MGDGRVPVGELTLDGQKLPGLATGVAEVAIGEGERRDPGLGELLGEGVEAHLPGGAESVPEDHDGRVGDAVGQEESGRAGVALGVEADVVTGDGVAAHD